MATENCLKKPGLITNGFRRAGLSPWNPESPDTSKLIPSSIFEAGNFVPSIPPITLSALSPVLDICLSGVQLSPAEAIEDILNSDEIFQENYNADMTAPDIHHLDSTQDSHPYEDTIPDMTTADETTQESIPSIETNKEIITVDETSQESLLSEETTKDMASAVEITQDNLTSNKNIQDFLSPEVSLMNDENSPGDLSPPVLSSPYWSGNTVTCSICLRRILKNLLDIHRSSCKASPSVSLSPPSVTSPSPSSSQTPIIPSLPMFSLSDRVTQLNKYEVLMLTQEQVSDFNKLFVERRLEVAEPIFQAWVLLKNATLPSEFQALSNVFSDHTATNIPKRQRKRNATLPVRPARYDPSSPEWKKILVDQLEKKTPAKRAASSSAGTVPQAKKKKHTTSSTLPAAEANKLKTTNPSSKAKAPKVKNHDQSTPATCKAVNKRKLRI